jgi:hypothetical protein
MTYPAAAIAAKSLSVMKVFQCSMRAPLATTGFWNSQKVHSSMILESPVASNRLGVIQGYEAQRVVLIEREGR